MGRDRSRQQTDSRVTPRASANRDSNRGVDGISIPSTPLVFRAGSRRRSLLAKTARTTENTEGTEAVGESVPPFRGFADFNELVSALGTGDDPKQGWGRIIRSIRSSHRSAIPHSGLPAAFLAASSSFFCSKAFLACSVSRRFSARSAFASSSSFFSSVRCPALRTDSISFSR